MKRDEGDTLPLGMDKIVYLGGRGTRRITCLSWFSLSLLVLCGILFLVLTFIRSNSYIVLRKYCQTGEAVVPDPSAYFIGPIAFHRTEPYIEWDFYHSLIASIGALDIIGPIDPGNPEATDAPVFLRLCEMGTIGECLLETPNNMQQRIVAHPITGQPIDDLVDQIVTYSHRYRLLLSTRLPNGTLVPEFLSPFNSLC